MVEPTKPQSTAAPFATVEANIAHLPEAEQERQRNAGKGAEWRLSAPQRFAKTVPHPDPTVPPTRIEVTAQHVTVSPEGSTYQIVTEDGPVHARSGDILVTDPWNKQWIVSKSTFDEQGHVPLGPAEEPEHTRDDS